MEPIIVMNAEVRPAIRSLDLLVLLEKRTLTLSLEEYRRIDNKSSNPNCVIRMDFAHETGKKRPK